MIVGVLGGGQLARMLALAGHPLGLRFVFLDPAPDACAAALGEHLRADYVDPEGLARLADDSDHVTFEFENVSPASLEWLARRKVIRPAAAEALAIARDRLREKTLFTELGIPTPAFAAVDDRDGLDRAVAAVGLPAVLKTRTLGYDGKGQRVLRAAADVDDAWRELGGVPLILEAFVAFRREVSIIAARGGAGEVACYPVTENLHQGGILRRSIARPGDPLQAQAEGLVRALLARLDYVGVLALELFDVDGTLVANEIAPRVHNSGHWTIEGAYTSQFENHLRAILGLPLGITEAVEPCAMVNLIGGVPDRAAVLAIPGAHLHLYGKPARTGRKLGHVTLLAADDAELAARVAAVEAVVAASNRV